MQKLTLQIAILRARYNVPESVAQALAALIWGAGQ